MRPVATAPFTGGFLKEQVRNGKKTPSLQKADSKPGLTILTLKAVTKPQNLGKVKRGGQSPTPECMLLPPAASSPAV